MVGAAFAYTKQVPHSKKVQIFFFTWIGLEIAIEFFWTVILGKSIQSINSSSLLRIVIYFGAYVFLIDFWNKLPEDEKVRGW